jgi:multidrug efflux system membrane fusion protein
VRLIVDTIKQAVVVPSPAIKRGPNGAYVYVLGDGEVVTLRNVTTGHQDENIAVVTQGLATGERVVTSGFARLSNGSRVRVVAAPEGAALAKPAQDPDTRPLGGTPSLGGGERRGPRSSATPSDASPGVARTK